MRCLVFRRAVHLAFSILSLSGAHAQVDTTLRGFFPLHVGDLWEYEIDDYPTYPRFQVRNIGDTLMPNGISYFHFDGLEEEFYRLDSLLRVFKYSTDSACVNSEYIQYQMDVSDGTVWYQCPIPGSTDSSFVRLVWTMFQPYPNLGMSLLTKAFCQGISGVFGCKAINLARGMGQVFSIYEGPPTNLVGAIINGTQYGSVTAITIDADKQALPSTRIVRNYPNPFNYSTVIQFEVRKKSLVKIQVFDLLGRLIKTIVNEISDIGHHRLHWNGTDEHNLAVPSGIYIARLVSETNGSSIKLVYLR